MNDNPTPRGLVRKITPGGVITTIATPADLSTVQGVAVDAVGNVFIAETGGHRIRKVSTGGGITTVAGTGVAGFTGDAGQATTARFTAPEGVAVDSFGNLYIADTGNSRVRRLTPTGVITTVAGNGRTGFGGDGGLAINAIVSRPRRLAFDNAGNLYISDESTRIRKVATDRRPRSRREGPPGQGPSQQIIQAASRLLPCTGPDPLRAMKLC